jgi:hypothetical protein
MTPPHQSLTHRDSAADEGPSLARACTAFEDWLESHHPRSPLRTRLRDVRRRLEARAGRG